MKEEKVKPILLAKANLSKRNETCFERGYKLFDIGRISRFCISITTEV